MEAKNLKIKTVHLDCTFYFSCIMVLSYSSERLILTRFDSSLMNNKSFDKNPFKVNGANLTWQGMQKRQLIQKSFR